MAIKKMMSAFLAVCLVLIFASVPTHAESNVKLIVNSEIITPDSPPVVINGSTLVSLKSLSKLNLSLVWSSKNKSVTVTTKENKNKLVLKVGEKVSTFGDQKLPLGTPVQLKNNRVMVPLRFISEAFKAYVNWDKETNTIVIRSLDKLDKYSTLYQVDDLAAARKVAVSLPQIGENTFSTSQELSSHQLLFPEGEALRYYYVYGNHISYYEVKNDVSYLVWEGREGDQPGTYSKENGKRPAPEKSEVHFDLERDSTVVTYGKVNSGEELKGELVKSKDGFLPGMIYTIAGETRTDKKAK
ncbi:hypothetical protein FHS19_001671 [Paenibacillus rhizosphaerae]|uniref:Copper amine oxidase-like N-terminal domain-containing protein n=1 Tax=Paenibacillus rhizosphaerae TaxID=297318 RepID=A0A839TQJ1_9BACL|nr:copper amine oxidase N-terminal domain-containing protein [Paenibacillus rhizosphaerae]MBB3127017.1 hypothetical protein [Paenibacillus rhizosphaerae]